MDLYLAESLTRPWLYSWGGMELYLAGEHTVKNGTEMLRRTKEWRSILQGDTRATFAICGGGIDNQLIVKYKQAERWKHINVLESFFYVEGNTAFPELMKAGAFEKILIDSGAFTFMQNSKTKVDWDDYTIRYSNFINRFDISTFIELDIDSLVGLSEVERLRSKLESLTGKKPIPVWHKSRGRDYFIKMASEYPYVAIGGIVTKEIPTDKYESAFPWFIREAHNRGAKIHGLGYTSIEGMKRYHFDSVDSTAWLYGNRGGYLYRFLPNGSFEKINAPKGKRLHPHKSALHNFDEWLKFQEYARKSL